MNSFHARTWLAFAIVLVGPYACSGETLEPSRIRNDSDASLQPLDAATGADGSAPELDATPVDAALVDASVPDVTTTDSSTTDAAPTDAGPADVTIDDDASSDAAADGAADANPDADVDAGPPGTIPTSGKAVTQQDLVSPGDKGLTGDGSNDGTIVATVVGPVDGLILVTTDSNGNPAGGQQWDTLSGSDALPNIASGFTLGSQTWVLGVFENGVLVNDSDARISLGAGVHALTLAASSSGFFNAGQHFRLYVRAIGGSWTGGPTFQW